MRLRQENCLGTTLLIWLAFFAVFQSNEVQAARGLTRTELIGYSQWLHALDTPVIDEALYPSGLSRDDIAARSYERRRTAARAILDYDESIGRAWNSNNFSSLSQSLNIARTNCEILDFERAMKWYGLALQSNGIGDSDTGLAREMFATAIMSGDSLLVLEQLLNTVGAPRLSNRSGAVVLAYRHYLYERDTHNLDLLMEKVTAQLEAVSAEVKYWHAFSLIHLGRRAEALPVLVFLARDARLAESLTVAQTAWFVRALPDALYLQDRRRDAMRLYRLLSVREDLDAGRWARYQVANDLLLAGHYDEATPLLKEACDAPNPTLWQLRSCELAHTATALNEIKKEGTRYGTDSLHVR